MISNDGCFASGTSSRKPIKDTTASDGSCGGVSSSEVVHTYYYMYYKVTTTTLRDGLTHQGMAWGRKMAKVT